MIDPKRWNVVIAIDEHDGRTKATAHLQSQEGERLTGVGFARCNPADHEVPEIGDELAVARALADLSNRLLSAAATDIGENTQHPDVRL